MFRKFRTLSLAAIAMVGLVQGVIVAEALQIMPGPGGSVTDALTRPRIPIEKEKGRDPKPTARKFPKMESALEELVSAPVPQKTAAKRNLRFDGASVQVVIEAVDQKAVSQLTAVLTDLGAERISSARNLIQANVHADALGELAGFSEVVRIRRPMPLVSGPIEGPPVVLVEKAMGTFITEGVSAMNGDDWHDVGFLGQGVRVGVIDGGFNGWGPLVGTELPTNTYYQDFSAFGPSSSAHGTACAEIISDVAPGIDALYLAEVATSVDIANAVDALVAEGVDVISMSLGLFGSSPGDGSGFLQSVINDYVSLGGIWANSAGNQRLSHWQGYWNDSNVNYYLDFPHGYESNFFTIDGSTLASIPEGTQITVYLTWNQWYAPTTDLDLHLYYWDGVNPFVEVASSIDIQQGLPGDRPVESVSIPAPATGAYGVMVDWWSGTTAVDIEIFARPDIPLEARVSDGSIAQPSDALGSITVAALDGGSPHTLEQYSARGPDNGTGGTLYGGPINPDIGGYANVSTASYGSRAGSSPFNGTSAACPHVAGAAALAWSGFTTFNNVQIRGFLEASAVDLGPGGKDNDYGYGRLWLGSPPCDYSINPTSTSTNAGGGSDSVSVTATASCPWTASSNTGWISISSGFSGAGDGSVGYSVAANASTSPRSGTLTIANRTFTVNQAGAPCTYSIAPTSADFGYQGGSGSVTVTTSTGCTWSASSNNAWLGVTSGSSGSGSGTVGYSVDENSEFGERTGSLTIAGETFTVNQDANPAFVFSDGFESGDTGRWSSSTP